MCLILAFLPNMDGAGKKNLKERGKQKPKYKKFLAVGKICDGNLLLNLNGKALLLALH